MSSDTPTPPVVITTPPAADKNYVSFWFWFFMPLLIGIPCVGPIIAIVLAFAGNNESQKNFFRAMLAWMLIALTFWILMMVVFGLSLPVIIQMIDEAVKELERQRGM